MPTLPRFLSLKKRARSRKTWRRAQTWRTLFLAFVPKLLVLPAFVSRLLPFFHPFSRAGAGLVTGSARLLSGNSHRRKLLIGLQLGSIFRRGRHQAGALVGGGHRRGSRQQPWRERVVLVVVGDAGARRDRSCGSLQRSFLGTGYSFRISRRLCRGLPGRGFFHALLHSQAGVVQPKAYAGRLPAEASPAGRQAKSPRNRFCPGRPPGP